MNTNQRHEISKRLSYVLRHAPEAIGITLDEAGWTPIDTLLVQLAAHGDAIAREQLDEVVAKSPKNRFEVDAGGTRIRARQGHSVGVALGYDQVTPPDVLYHGTSEQAVDAILLEGLDRRARHDVHLSVDAKLMMEVGRRHGTPVLLRIDAKAMIADAHVFTLTGNNVYLTERVPPQYITRQEGKPT